MRRSEVARSLNGLDISFGVASGRKKKAGAHFGSLKLGEEFFDGVLELVVPLGDLLDQRWDH